MNRPQRRGNSGESVAMTAVIVCPSAGLGAYVAARAGVAAPETGSCHRHPSKLDGAHQIVRQRKPEQDGADFLETADPKLLQSPIAGDGIDALGGRGPELVDRLRGRSEEHTSELQSRQYLVCR